MSRKTARDFDPQVLRLFDKYVHGDLSRRGFLQSAGKVAAGAPASWAAASTSPPCRSTTPRYDDAAARPAWQRTLALFDRTQRA
jgi:dienelactone hydrolase